MHQACLKTRTECVVQRKIALGTFACAGGQRVLGTFLNAENTRCSLLELRICFDEAVGAPEGLGCLRIESEVPRARTLQGLQPAPRAVD